MKTLISLTLSALLLAAAAPTYAESTVLALQGGLRTAAGGPVADGNYPIAVALYADEKAQLPIYLEKFLAVAVSGGAFAIELGVIDPSKQLDSALFANAQAQFVGITVSAENELPRAHLRAVPYAQRASVAGDVNCSGCIGGSDIAAGAIEAKHVAFNYASSAAKGGVADSAVVAQTAKNAEFAASADEANSAKTAAKLECSGCVTAAMLSGATVADLTAAGKLSKVASTGQYADLTGKPDNSLFATLAGKNAFAADNSFLADVGFSGTTTLAKPVLSGDIDFAKHQAKLFRFQVAAAAPVACDASSVGLAYFDSTATKLMVCNGKNFVSFKSSSDVGSANNPAVMCKAIFDQDPTSADGVYTIDPDGAGPNAAFQAYCDIATGGWTLIAKVNVANKEGADEPHDWFQQSLNTGLLAAPAVVMNAGLASFGAGKFTAYATANTLARFTTIAEDDLAQTASFYKGADPAALAKWFNGDATPTKVCADVGMSKFCGNGTIAYDGDTTKLSGMDLSAFGFSSSSTIHMRLNGDVAPTYTAICSGTDDKDGNKWHDSMDSHWGNGLTIWLR